MGEIAYGRCGEISTSEGQTDPLTTDKLGAQIVLSKAGKYKSAALAGRLFSVANQAAVATTAALATTWTGLGVCNPAGSGKNLIIHEFGFSLSLAAAKAGSVGLMISDDTGFTDSLTKRAGMYGSGSSVAYCSAGCTIATPVLERIIGDYGTAATSAKALTGPFIYEVDGSIILPPDRSVLTYTTLDTTAAFIFHFMWEEVPV